MTNEEKILSWKGERVILLNPMLNEFAYRELYRYRNGQPGASLPKDGYTYRTGVVREAKVTGTRRYGPLKTYRLVVRLDDSGEEILVDDSIYGEFGFFAEMEAAKALIGRTFWAKGGKELYDPSEYRTTWGARRIFAKNTEMLTVTRVDWGRDGLLLCFETRPSQEGCLRSPVAFHHRFIQFGPGVGEAHPVDVKEFCKEASASFYCEDPRKLYPRWSKTIWELIENGEISIGMTEEMAEAACGAKLHREGSILASPDIVSPILSCRSKRFLVVNGKVARYVESK
jgi:hypothetical protein